MVDKMLQTREEYADLIRRELLGPGSEISVPDDEHELISSSPDGRYSLDSVYMRSSQNSQPNSDTPDMNSRKER